MRAADKQDLRSHGTPQSVIDQTQQSHRTRRAQWSEQTSANIRLKHKQDDNIPIESISKECDFFFFLAALNAGNRGELLLELAKASLSNILIPLHILVITQCHQANLAAAKCVYQDNMHPAQQMSSQLWEPTAVRRAADLQSDPCIPHPAVTAATQLPSRPTLDPPRLSAYVQIVSLILRQEATQVGLLQSRVHGSNVQDSRCAASKPTVARQEQTLGSYFPYTQKKVGGVAQHCACPRSHHPKCLPQSVTAGSKYQTRMIKAGPSRPPPPLTTTFSSSCMYAWF